MGRQNAPEKLFYQFRLEDHIPSDHPLRQLDAVLNFDHARMVLAEHYSSLDRPSIDPELMLRMLLVGYAYGIRSERQLCNEVHLNLAYREKVLNRALYNAISNRGDGGFILSLLQ